MSNRVIPPYLPELREAAAEAVRSTEPLLDDLVAHCLPTPKVRIILALNKVKQTHGRARREALRELDRVVTDLFPPVEGAPLPSEELNGKPDVYLDCFLMPRKKSGLTSCFHDAPGPSTEYRFFLQEASPVASLSGASAVHYCFDPVYAPFPIFNRTKKK